MVVVLDDGGDGGLWGGDIGMVSIVVIVVKLASVVLACLAVDVVVSVPAMSWLGIQAEDITDEAILDFAGITTIIVGDDPIALEPVVVTRYEEEVPKGPTSFLLAVIV